MTVGIVTCEKCSQLTESEQSLIPLLAAKGIAANPLVWNDPTVSWSSCDFLLVRSIWDYHLYPNVFSAWLRCLEDLKITTWNPLAVLHRNSHKFYLRDLEKLGVRIVPTMFQKKDSSLALSDVRLRGWSKVIVKPAVSASAYRTEVISPSSPAAEAVLSGAASHGDFLVQKFMPAVQQSGELSLIFFNHQFSHAVLKRPRPGEFRVQKEYGGGSISLIPDQITIQTAEEIIAHFGSELLYARVDGIILNGEFILMELELIEPDLFLESDPGATQRFVDGLVSRIQPEA